MFLSARNGTEMLMLLLQNLLKGDDFYRIRLPSNVLSSSSPGREYVISSVKAVSAVLSIQRFICIWNKIRFIFLMLIKIFLPNFILLSATKCDYFSGFASVICVSFLYDCNGWLPHSSNLQFCLNAEMSSKRKPGWTFCYTYGTLIHTKFMFAAYQKKNYTLAPLSDFSNYTLFLSWYLAILYSSLGK